MVGRKILGSDTRVFSSHSLVLLSEVRDSLGRKVFRGTMTPDTDCPGLVVFLDMFPGDPFPHLCRYVFVSTNGRTEIVDAVHEPAAELPIYLSSYVPLLASSSKG